MANVTHQGTHWYFLTTPPALLTGPTSAEISAGSEIEEMTGFDVPSSQASVDTSNTTSTYDTMIGGTTSVGPVRITMKRDDADESAGWDLFQLGDNGALVCSRFGPATTGAKVEVYPVEVGQRIPASFTKNAVVTFDVSFFVTEAPAMDAVVDGGS